MTSILAVMGDNDYKLDRGFGDMIRSVKQHDLVHEIKTIDQRYGEEKPIAKGGMKSISVITDSMTGRKVAKASLIKFDDDDTISRFFHEARICASLEHPNIVPVYDLGYDQDKLPFFTMRLLGGETLQSLVMNEKLELGECLDIFVKVCDAVSYAHSQGVIHRDLKPDNIQIGEFGEVQVCDWGIAHVDGAVPRIKTEEKDDLSYNIPVTLDGHIQGTPGFIAPEQIEGGAVTTKASDIYSLGAILYFLLTGKRPLFSKTVEVTLEKAVAGEIEPVEKYAPETPESLRAICRKAMALEAADRYISVEAFKTDILKYQHGYATEAEGAGTWTNTVLFVKRNKRLTLLTAAFVAILNISLFIFLYNVSREKNRAVAAEQQVLEALGQLKESEAIARTAEAQATANLEKLIRITSERDKVAKDAAPRFYTEARQQFNRLEFMTALENGLRATTLDPKFGKAHHFLGILYVGLHKFDKAHRSFKQAGDVTHDTTKAMALEFSRKYKRGQELGISELIEIMKVLEMKHQPYDFLKSLVYSPKLNRLTADERRQLAIAGYSIFGEGTPQPVFENDTVSNVWTNSNHFLFCLLYKTEIKEFDFSFSTLTNIPMIKGESTRKLTVGNFPPAYFKNDLELCPNLEEIIVSERYNKPEFTKDIPEHIKISTYTVEQKR